MEVDAPPTDLAFVSFEDANVDEPRLALFQQAITNVLSLPHVELTLAQIVDGVPVYHVYRSTTATVPPIVQSHRSLCDGVMERVRMLRDAFDIGTLRFTDGALRRYKDVETASAAFSLCLIELVAVAVHQIAAYLYQSGQDRQGHGFHDPAFLRQEMTRDRAFFAHNPRWQLDRWPDKTYFFNRYYRLDHKYPYGVADVVGYWAEIQIFGGVVVFDRGPTDDGNYGMFLSEAGGGYNRIFAPTEAAYKSFVAFLTATSPPAFEVLPFRSAGDHHREWDSQQAFRDLHVFRDRYEQELVPVDYGNYGGCRRCVDLTREIEETTLMMRDLNPTSLWPKVFTITETTDEHGHTLEFRRIDAPQDEEEEEMH